MKLLVLGATGGTGIEIVQQALRRGHSVTAFVRSPERLQPFTGQISVKQGNLLNATELAQVVKGHDAVLSGFGPRLPVSKADANLLQQFGSVQGVRDAGEEAIAKLPGFNAERARKLLESLAATAPV
jgi:putative NADH-flavin reductase